MLGKTAPHNVDRLPDDDAIALLREFHAALTDADAAALVRLCAGLPLALRLAGAHLALDAAERGGAPDIAGYLGALGGGRLATLDAGAADAGEITVGDRRGEAIALFNSAEELAKLGQREEARVRAEQAADIFAAIESPHAGKVREFADSLRGEA